MKYKQYLISFVIILVTILFIYLERKNTLKIEKVIDCSKIDRFLFNKLDSLVSENRFNRQYYEVIVYYNSGCNNSYVLNYNTKYQLLRLSSNPCSGFSGFAKSVKKNFPKLQIVTLKLKIFTDFIKVNIQKIMEYFLREPAIRLYWTLFLIN